MECAQSRVEGRSRMRLLLSRHSLARSPKASPCSSTCSCAAIPILMAISFRRHSHVSWPENNNLPIEQGSGRRELAEWLARARQSTACSRDGESNLAGTLRGGHRAHRQQFRHRGRTAHSSRTARLAGRRVHRARMVGEEDASADHALERVPDEQRDHTGEAARKIPTIACCRASECAA